MCGFVSFFFLLCKSTTSSEHSEASVIHQSRWTSSTVEVPQRHSIDQQFVKTTCCFFPEREVIFALLLSLFFRLPSQQQPCGERRAAVAREPGCSHKLNSSSQSFQGGNVSLAHPTVWDDRRCRHSAAKQNMQNTPNTASIHTCPHVQHLDTTGVGNSGP